MIYDVSVMALAHAPYLLLVTLINNPVAAKKNGQINDHTIAMIELKNEFSVMTLS